jgi:hypothetical protein
MYVCMYVCLLRNCWDIVSVCKNMYVLGALEYHVCVWMAVRVGYFLFCAAKSNAKHFMYSNAKHSMYESALLGCDGLQWMCVQICMFLVCTVCVYVYECSYFLDLVVDIKCVYEYVCFGVCVCVWMFILFGIINACMNMYVLGCVYVYECSYFLDMLVDN